MITILGPTASGKTKLAAQLASELNGEVVSADSRQVYREMDLGTGKDYDDYIVNGKKIPYHLIDIADPGTEFNVYRYQKEFIEVFKDIFTRNKMPVLCGGSGLYLESVLKGYRLIEVPVNIGLRTELENKSLSELINILASFRNLHSTTDSTDKARTTRAIEIETYNKQHKNFVYDFPKIRSLIIGIQIEREILRKRITGRLQNRLNSGMIAEIKGLLEKGILPEMLMHYGLEYKYITLFVLGKISFDEMFRQLNTAIHQFAKRQMTWFRKMEKSGITIHWIDGTKSTELMVGEAIKLKKNYL